jgi:hypothetical protein
MRQAEAPRATTAPVPIPLRLVSPSTQPPAAQPEVSNLHTVTERLAQAIAEVLAGARPAAQLATVATAEVVALLHRNAGRLGVRTGVRSPRPIVCSVHVSQPVAGVAEVCAVIDTGPRRRAIALRLENTEGRWRCTDVQVG